MMPGFSLRVHHNRVESEIYFSEQYDNIHFKTEHFEFALEGLILNKKKLLQEFAVSDFKNFIAERFHFRGIQFIDELEGEFRGFIHDFRNNKMYAFTNPTATQRVFYTKNESGIFVDSSLVRLNKTVKTFGISTKPDMESVYQLLALGNMLEDQCIVENFKKIPDASYLEINRDKSFFSVKPYFFYENIEIFKNLKEEAIKQIHEVFKNSVNLEYEKDLELGSKHLSLLSGGLDSRVAMMYALKIDQNPDNVLCFSHSGYFDETISRKISEDYDLHYEFVPLDGGNFLKKIDQLTKISEGASLYTGGIHVQHALDELKYENFKIFHSGQIGDGILGGFNSATQKKKPSVYKIVSKPQFQSKIQENLNSVFKKYESEEIFLLKNLAFNRTVLGAQVFQQKAYQTSPFMTKDFMKLAISLPEKWKFKQKFYIEWISKYCKEATKYTWERTLMKPNANWKTTFGDLFVKKGFIFLNDKILKSSQNSSMYPYQYYYDSSKEIQDYYKDYFNENFERISDYPELSNDVKTLFLSDKFTDKSLAVNVLSIFKLFFD